MPVGTAFHERTFQLCESLSYREWSGYYAVSSYEPHHEHEYNAIRNTSALKSSHISASTSASSSLSAYFGASTNPSCLGRLLRNFKRSAFARGCRVVRSKSTSSPGTRTFGSRGSGAVAIQCPAVTMNAARPFVRGSGFTTSRSLAVSIRCSG